MASPRPGRGVRARDVGPERLTRRARQHRLRRAGPGPVRSASVICGPAGAEGDATASTGGQVRWLSLVRRDDRRARCEGRWFLWPWPSSSVADARPARRRCPGPGVVLRLGARQGAGGQGAAAVDEPVPQPHFQPRPGHPGQPVADLDGRVVRVSGYLQVVRHYDAIQTGVIFTAATIGLLMSSLAAARLAKRYPQRTLILAGL